MKYRYYCSLLLIMAGLWGMLTDPGRAQQVDFSTYSDYGLQLFTTNQQLIFGENGQVISGEGTVEIPLSNSSKRTTIAIEGVKFLDVSVTISAPQFIYLNGNMSSDEKISLNLDAAYANLGQDSYAQAELINLGSDNSGTVRFRIKGRGQGPPRPPPVPPHKGYTPPKDRAYLYIYGSIDVGNVNAGEYSTTVNVNVSYAQSN
jgi:hypothetical protein